MAAALSRARMASSASVSARTWSKCPCDRTIASIFARSTPSRPALRSHTGRFRAGIEQQAMARASAHHALAVFPIGLAQFALEDLAGAGQWQRGLCDLDTARAFVTRDQRLAELHQI